MAACVGGILACWPLGNVPGTVVRLPVPVPVRGDWPLGAVPAVLAGGPPAVVPPVWRMPPDDGFPDPATAPVLVGALAAAVRGPTGCGLGTVKEAVRG